MKILLPVEGHFKETKDQQASVIQNEAQCGECLVLSVNSHSLFILECC